MNKQQLRQWILASVAVALFLGVSFTLIDTQKIYTALQKQLLRSNIQLQAGQLNLSLMYTGSLRLDNVHIQANTFDMEAQRLFIDLDLAALLTGKALPQALFLQSATINITQDKKQAWLDLLETDGFNLKRIDISQSEIHFEQQHITLEKVDLDIRDIGKNRNPRMELRAHIGDGRIDAHGYLHVKRGEITKGFSRVKLYDIPLTSWFPHTTLGTLSGSITSHLNKDSSWQSFGHITLQEKESKKDTFELRAKVIGNHENFLAIDEMVLNHKGIGAVQVSGKCSHSQQCDFTLNSEKLFLPPLLNILKYKAKAEQTIENIQIKTSLSDGKWFTSAQASWDAFDYISASENKKDNIIHILPSTLLISNFIWSSSDDWQINQASILAPQQTTPEIELNNVLYHNDELELPITLHHTQYWLPTTQLAALNQINISGSGTMDGYIHLNFKQKTLRAAELSLNADKAELHTPYLNKPTNVPLHIEGSTYWDNNNTPQSAKLSLQLASSTLTAKLEASTWSLSDINIHLDALKDEGIQWYEPWQLWHGEALGKLSFNRLNNTLNIKSMIINLNHFGKAKHQFSGQVSMIDGNWKSKGLQWSDEKHSAKVISYGGNRFNIIASAINAEALSMLKALPFQAYGRIKAEKLHLPFGTLSKVSSRYKTHENGISLTQFKSSFYEGSLASDHIDIFKHNQELTLRGKIQVGGIHLNNWLWLHKQFGTHLEATIYATLNLEGIFDEKYRLFDWKGDGDVTVYNGKWLFHDKNITADKVALSLRKRKEFNTSFNIKNGKQRGSGHLRIDEQDQVSGTMQWQGTTYEFSKTWPNFKYAKTTPKTP